MPSTTTPSHKARASSGCWATCGSRLWCRGWVAWRRPVRWATTWRSRPVSSSTGEGLALTSSGAAVLVAGPLADDEGVAVLAHDQRGLAGLQLGSVFHTLVLGVIGELDADLLAVGASDGQGYVGHAVFLAPVVGDVLETVLASDDEVAVDDALEVSVGTLAPLSGGLLGLGCGRGRRG